jgi:hypothetical protein
MKIFELLLSFCCLANIILCLIIYYIAHEPQMDNVAISLKIMVTFVTGMSVVFMVMAKLTMAKIIKDDHISNMKKLVQNIVVTAILLLPHPSAWTHGICLPDSLEGYYVDDLLTACVLLRVIFLGRILLKSLSYYGTRYVLH